MSEVNKESKEEISYEPDPLLEAMRSVVGHDEELLAEWSDTGYFTRAMMAMKEYAYIRTANLQAENERLRKENEMLKKYGLITRNEMLDEAPDDKIFDEWNNYSLLVGGVRMGFPIEIIKDNFV